MRKRFSLIIFILGLLILLYPFVSQYWNSLVMSRAISNYDNISANIDSIDIKKMLEEASYYNQELNKKEFPLVQYKELTNYSKLINVNSNGMMGYIEIIKLGLKLPIYHGTSPEVLNIAVGHLEGSSIPIGGPNTHSVLSAHRGLPSAKLFTNLNKLELGDTFIIYVLDQELIYQVDNIVTVEPDNISYLEIIDNKDLVTLMTCTPYGINTHRLLVRGTRIDNSINNTLVITNEAYKIDNNLVSLLITLFIFIIFIIGMMLKTKYKVNTKEER